MTKRLNRLLTILLAIAVIFSMTVPSFAEEPQEEETTPVVTETESMNIGDAEIKGIKDRSYTGKRRTLDITVRSKITVTTDGVVTDTYYSKNALKKRTDYTVSYSNNKNRGTATVTIKGKGRYSGTVTKHFKIYVRKGTLKKKGKNWYIYKDGKPLKSGWVTNGKRYCYAGKDGKLKHNTMFKVNGKYYYARKNCNIARKKFKYNGMSLTPNKKTGAISAKAYKKAKKRAKTYIRVDISSQSIVFYKHGKKIVSGSVVTGKNSTPTPKGTYRIRAKQKSTYLVRPNEYKVYVKYWMPFIGNSYGLHDAPWRGAFGGNIYKYGGSHGCVNLPNRVASKIYKYAPVGTKVIIRR